MLDTVPPSSQLRIVIKLTKSFRKEAFKNVFFSKYTSSRPTCIFQTLVYIPHGMILIYSSFKSFIVRQAEFIFYVSR
jgi:hypothetical protein